jgi:inorganic pyrophosphatase
VYKDLEGKKVEIMGWKPALDAKEIVVESHKRYQQTLRN